MNTPTENSGETGKRKNLAWLVGLAAVAGLVIVAAVVLNARKPAPAGSGVAGKEAAYTTGRAATETVNKNAAITTAAQTSLGASTFAEQMKLLANMSLMTSERRKVAEALARDGSVAAIAALKQAFANGSEDMRVAIAESLGKCGSPECTKWLQELLKDPSVLVARGAVRGLASQDTPEAANTLISWLNATEASSDLRCEIASSLGDMTQPGIVQALSGMAQSTDNEDLATASVNALGSRDFAETESFFRNYLQSPDVPSDLRAQAVDALAQAKGYPSAFLSQLAATDSDPDVRAAAAWAMSATATEGNAGGDLLTMLQSEQDPDVRLRLYQALANQQSFDVNAALADVQKESNPSARIAGLDLLAKALRDNPTPALQSFFDKTAIPELKQMAVSGQSLDDRQAAIIALTRANTPQAQAALAEVSSQIAQMQTPPPSQASSTTSTQPARRTSPSRRHGWPRPGP